MQQFAVFGNPIKHSKSPQIHQLFAEQTGQQINYSAILAPEEGFVEAVSEFFQQGQGANVTVPFKEQAFAWADELSPRAQRAKAVNTLIKQSDGSILGDNTDGVGLVNDLLSQHVDIKDKKILVLGAGGAVRGILQPLLAQQPSVVSIANRTVERAEQLCMEFVELGPVAACGYDWIEAPVDIIINGTSASLHGDLPPIDPGLIAPGHTLCYDMMYSKEPTLFNRWAAQQGAARTLDGLGMLVGQAAESFYLWTGVRPEVEPVLKAIRATL